MGVFRNQKRLSEQEERRIIQLHREGLNYATIAQRVHCTARTVSRVVKRLEKVKTE